MALVAVAVHRLLAVLAHHRSVVRAETARPRLYLAVASLTQVAVVVARITLPAVLAVQAVVAMQVLAPARVLRERSTPEAAGAVEEQAAQAAIMQAALAAPALSFSR